MKRQCPHITLTQSFQCIKCRSQLTQDHANKLHVLVNKMFLSKTKLQMLSLQFRNYSRPIMVVNLDLFFRQQTRIPSEQEIVSNNIQTVNNFDELIHFIDSINDDKKYFINYTQSQQIMLFQQFQMFKQIIDFQPIIAVTSILSNSLLTILRKMNKLLFTFFNYNEQQMVDKVNQYYADSINQQKCTCTNPSNTKHNDFETNDQQEQCTREEQCAMQLQQINLNIFSNKLLFQVFDNPFNYIIYRQYDYQLYFKFLKQTENNDEIMIEQDSNNNQIQQQQQIQNKQQLEQNQTSFNAQLMNMKNINQNQNNQTPVFESNGVIFSNQFVV